jgi:hypothetical protein
MNTHQPLEALAIAATSDPILFGRISTVETIEEFTKIASEIASIHGINLPPTLIADALSADSFGDVAIGDAQLESAAGFGYGHYACTDNSNFTAQRASACLPCR